MKTEGLTMTKKPASSFEEWLQHDALENIHFLREQKELFERNKINKKDFNRSLESFVNLLKSDFFGDKIIFIVESVKELSNGESVVVNAQVMQINEKGEYEPCAHPFKPKVPWSVSSTISKAILTQSIKPGLLFEAKYTKHILNLITPDLKTYTDVEESFMQTLKRLGGSILAENAEKLFGLDAEKVIVTKILDTYDLIEKDLLGKFEKMSTKFEKLELQELDYAERKEKLTEKQLEWHKILNNIKNYTELENNSPEEETGEFHSWNAEKAIELLQTLIYHNSEDDLIYDETVIEMFLRSLQINTLIILSGPSGTGKSSIVTHFAQAIKGAKAKVVPVQSGWTDTQDLLGYFNPIEKCYVPSPFMEALADAASDPDHLHLICLDEINLAHVEYYFSEFLSIREQKKPRLQLYNKRYFLHAKHLLNENSPNTKYEELLNASDLIYRYPYQFEIPKNVRFIGTMNMDHTVKSLSPKVIDRSFIIEINHMDKQEKMKLTTKLNENKFTGKLEVTLDEFSAVYKEVKAFEKEAQALVELSQSLNNIANAPLNSRGKNQVVHYLDRIPEDKLTKDLLEKYFDQLIFTKILPRIELSTRDEKGIECLKQFQQEIEVYPRSAEKLEQMLRDDRVIGFW